MDEKVSALYSEYVIDGVARELTPARMLGGTHKGGYAAVVDESVDPDLLNRNTVQMSVSMSASMARNKVSETLLNVLWNKGHFRIGNLSVSPSWRWNEERIGNMAAFYASVETLAEYCDELGLTVRDFSYARTSGECSLDVSVDVEPALDDMEKPFCVESPSLLPSPQSPSTLVNDSRSWIIYVPFETEWGSHDPDYFIDCYELVRELVEDDIILSGRTVTGGLGHSLEEYVSASGAVLRLAGIKRYFELNDTSRILSDDIKGVLFQIRDMDYDYIDAEFLLQDVAYFPLGHPSEGGLRLDLSDKTGIQAILESLINNENH